MNRLSIGLAAALLSSLLLLTSASDKPKPLISGPALQIPAAGFTINGLRDMKLIPQPRPTACKWSLGDKRIETYPMLDLAA
jgi:hypothetical protein